MSIVFPYAGALALLFVVLSVRTLRLRRRLRVAVGDRGNEVLLRAMRVHANFAEYVPLALLLLFFSETAGARPIFIHLSGTALVIGRLCHAWGVSHVNENYRFRVVGVALTLAVIVSAALRLLGSALVLV
jgi:uncharacterized membrane protein YecN with MAPEG domain